MLISKPQALAVLALAAGTASAHKKPELVTTICETTTIYASPPVTTHTPPSKETKTHVPETTWTTITKTVCDHTSCHEKPTTIPVQPAPVPPHVESPAPPAEHPAPPAESPAPPAQPPAPPAPQSSVPVIKKPEPTPPAPAPESSGHPTPSSSKATPSKHASSSAHRTTTTHTNKPEKTGGEVPAPPPAETKVPIANPGAKLIIPGLASLAAVGLGLVFLA